MTDRTLNRLRRIELEAAERGEPRCVHVSRLGRIESYSGADWFQASARLAVADVRRDCPGLDVQGVIVQCSIGDAWCPCGPRGVELPVRQLATRARARYRAAVELAAAEEPPRRRRNPALRAALASRVELDPASDGTVIGPEPCLGWEP